MGVEALMRLQICILYSVYIYCTCTDPVSMNVLGMFPPLTMDIELLERIKIVSLAISHSQTSFVEVFSINAS